MDGFSYDQSLKEQLTQNYYTVLQKPRRAGEELLHSGSDSDVNFSAVFMSSEPVGQRFTGCSL